MLLRYLFKQWYVETVICHGSTRFQYPPLLSSCSHHHPSFFGEVQIFIQSTRRYNIHESSPSLIHNTRVTLSLHINQCSYVLFTFHFQVLPITSLSVSPNKAQPHPPGRNFQPAAGISSYSFHAKYSIPPLSFFLSSLIYV